MVSKVINKKLDLQELKLRKEIQACVVRKVTGDRLMLKVNEAYEVNEGSGD